MLNRKQRLLRRLGRRHVEFMVSVLSFFRINICFIKQVDSENVGLDVGILL